jgi:hypothetical protein
VLITTHVASGALLGRVLRRPLPALLVGVASHAALDALPHWGRGRTSSRSGIDEFSLRIAVVDGLAGLGLIALVARATSRPHLAAVLAGVTGACAPDLDKPSKLVFGRSPFPAVVDAWHGAIQREQPHRLVQEVATSLGAAALVVTALRAEQRRH